MPAIPSLDCTCAFSWSEAARSATGPMRTRLSVPLSVLTLSVKALKPAARARSRSASASAGLAKAASCTTKPTFAAAGAALSVLLLITIWQRPLLNTLLSEQFAGEVMRTIVGSIGLVLSVPITTAIGVGILKGGNRRPDPVGSRPGANRGDELEDLTGDDWLDKH